MNLNDIKLKISFIRDNLIEIKKITDFVTIINTDDYELSVDPSTNMSETFSVKNIKLHEYWAKIQKNVPPGFSIDSNLMRHLSFNQANDWHDIAYFDIPRELTKIEEYKNRLVLIEYLDNLHPEVSRITNIVLSGDIDAALKTVFTTLDSKIRSFIKAKPVESTVAMIGKAIKDKIFYYPINEYNEAARNFLQGVIGYYRNYITHNPLPYTRNRIESSLSLFSLAHEAFLLLDTCSKPRGTA
jgi:hypothetical protein